MATTKLTPRQQEIRDLLDSGDTPADVAKKLKINENTIYQHLRRMKTGAKKSTTRRSTTRKSTTRSRPGTTASGSKRSTARGHVRRQQQHRRTTRRSGGRTPAAPPASPIEVRSMTPLQAIRNRREYIEQEIKESARRLEAATKAFEAEADAHGKLEASRADELKKLTAAEAALSDAKPKKRSGGPSRASKNGAGSRAAGRQAVGGQTPPARAPQAPAEPAPTPEPVEPPTGDEAMAAVGAEQERPGAATLPEFSQEGEDAFGGNGSTE